MLECLEMRGSFGRRQCVGTRRRFGRSNCVRVRGLLGGRKCLGARGRFGMRRFRQLRRPGAAGPIGRLGELGIEFVLERAQASEQQGLIDEIRRGLVDMGYDVFDRPNRVGQCGDSAIGQPVSAVVDLADEIVEWFGDPDTVPRFGHLRTAAQCMHCAIHRFGQMMRRGLVRALAQVMTDFSEVAECFLAVNVVQQRIHARRPVEHGRGRIGRRLGGFVLRNRKAVEWRPLENIERLRGRRGTPLRGLRRAGVQAHGVERGRLTRRDRFDGGSARKVAGTPVFRRRRRGDVFVAAVGERKRLAHDVVRGRQILAAGFQLFDQLRQGGDRSAQQRHHGRRARQGFVDETIQEILDRPAELRDQPRADHSAAAFQRMKAASQDAERLQIHGVAVP